MQNLGKVKFWGQLTWKESDWLEDGLNRGLDAVGSPAFPLWQETKVFSLVTLKPSAVDPVLGTLI